MNSYAFIVFVSGWGSQMYEYVGPETHEKQVQLYHLVLYVGAIDGRYFGFKFKRIIQQYIHPSLYITQPKISILFCIGFLIQLDK
jgi:hypothetical protein